MDLKAAFEGIVAAIEKATDGGVTAELDIVKAELAKLEGGESDLQKAVAGLSGGVSQEEFTGLQDAVGALTVRVGNIEEGITGAADELTGGGADTSTGSSGNDTTSGDSGADTTQGGEGDDSLGAGAGDDTASGTDTSAGDTSADTTSGGQADDSLTGGAGEDTTSGA